MFCELTIVLWALGQDNGGVPAEFLGTATGSGSEGPKLAMAAEI
jgi:hypothetical protein